ncbi:RNA exonuclease 1 homolog [Stegodyphus dumicola]|uniref:RNA exonuclease 1 homolog n=1 Tax=Stegodyphus dumicola TaxID=202533 RepID=UPI0015AC8520|nr:RNA exonuclease 1 homolog [Stegodyphus dumicola]
MDYTEGHTLFRTLRTHRTDVYSEFLPYILTDEQLHKHGFPVDSPNHLGRTTMYRENRATDPTQRCCVRCRDTFYILDDGTYHSETLCRFHTKKNVFQWCSTAGTYDCCYGNSMSEGLYALDCEMCYTTRGLEVAKIGIVGMDGLTVYESFVLPEHPILDYNTVYSGITANDLRGVSTTLADVETFLLKLLNKNSILVGHGLENDLKIQLHSQTVSESCHHIKEYEKKPAKFHKIKI